MRECKIISNSYTYFRDTFRSCKFLVSRLDCLAFFILIRLTYWRLKWLLKLGVCVSTAITNALNLKVKHQISYDVRLTVVGTFLHLAGVLLSTLRRTNPEAAYQTR